VHLFCSYELSFTDWYLNPNSGDTGGLLKNDWITWDEEKWLFIKPAFQTQISECPECWKLFENDI
jgi:hypothetical protein